MLIYRILFLSVAIVDFIIAMEIFRKDMKHSRKVGYAMCFAMLTTLFYLFAISTEKYFFSSLFSSLYFISIDYILVFLLRFVLEFTRFHKKINKQNPFCYIDYIVAGVDTIILLVNPFKEIALSYYPVMVRGVVIYKYLPFTMYRFHLLFCYILIALILGVLVRKCMTIPLFYIGKYINIALSIVLVVLLNIFYLAGKEYFVLDISVLFYSLSALLIYISVFYYSDKKLLNSTRELLMENIGWAIAFFDFENVLIDCNQKMTEIFPEFGHEKERIDFDEFSVKQRFPKLANGDRVFEWKHICDGEEHIFQCEYTCLKVRREENIGKMLVMHDITYTKDAVTGLDLSPGLYRHMENQKETLCYPVQLLVVNVNSLSVINNALGHEKGNHVMMCTVEMMRKVLGENTYLARMEDSSVIAVLNGKSREEGLELAVCLQKRIREDQTMGFSFEVEYGLSEIPNSETDVHSIVGEAIESMKNKKLLSESSNRSALIHSLTQTLLESDYETEEHVMRTKKAATALGTQMGLSDKEIGKLALLSVLHDIGKIGIPQQILLKPGKLEDDEWEIMKTHAEKGYRIAKASADLEPVAELILHHHERWDGNGYPDRLKGEAIPLLSRIITVVDSYDVMVHDRPYRKAISVEKAKQELRRCAGSQFDPEIVRVYLELLEKMKTSSKESE